MPDEVNPGEGQEQVEQQEQQTQATQEVTVDPFEDKARATGWKPLEEFDGDPETWVDAKEFIRRAPLFDKIKNQSKKNKELEKALTDLKELVKTVGEAGYKRAIADLQKEKRLAVEEADYEKVEAIDKEIDATREQMVKPPTSDNTPPPIDPVIKDWIDRPENAWFKKDEDLRVYAIGKHDTIIKNNPGMSVEDTLAELVKTVKQVFPQKFQNPNRKVAPPVESAAATAPGGKKTITYRDLNDEQRRIADRFERLGIMKKDDYVKQLAETGVVGG